ncbi:MAG TPA: AI-2E family transporter [Ktedonobacteraceae bacterium]|nr:AI-2E family transporter [Ktedonobacteraceae bacterium]
MSFNPRPFSKLRVDTATEPASRWAMRRDIPIAILAWIALVAVVLWVLGHVINSVLILVIAALLAYALTPAVRLLERVLPRFLSILIVYLIVLCGLSVIIYLVINTAISQVGSLVATVKTMLTPVNGQASPLVQTLTRIGITQAQIDAAVNQIVAQAEGLTSSIVPFLSGIFSFILNSFVVAVLSIYMLIDGARVTNWLRNNMPATQQGRMRFLLNTFQRIVGGYIRGQLTLSALVGVLVGIDMAIFHVPYAVLLGVLAFVLEFIPVLGTLTSGAICVLIALTQGWLIALLVLASFVVIHILEGDVIGPRIVGQAIGLHPIVSLIALIAGAELFGIVGALFASPLAGVLQALLVAIWSEWRAAHPDQFEESKDKLEDTIEENLPDHPVEPEEKLLS